MFVTDWLLQVSDFMFAVSVMTIAMMTIALCGMALGFGTLFPQFETENAAQIPTSFGGLMFMIASVGLIAGVVVLEARPVYGYLSAKLYGTPTSMTEMVFGFGLAATAVRRGDDHPDPDRESEAGGGRALGRSPRQSLQRGARFIDDRREIGVRIPPRPTTTA